MGKKLARTEFSILNSNFFYIQMWGVSPKAAVEEDTKVPEEMWMSSCPLMRRYTALT
jgi:hypothetical protein